MDGGRYLFGWQGVGKEIALGLIASELPETGELGIRFDAFGDGPQAQVGSEVDDRCNDSIVLILGFHPLHEGLVDFHEREG